MPSKPRNLPLPAKTTHNDFTTWNQTLRQHRPGLDTIFVDLDILDQNMATINAMLGPQFAHRTVTKGLPCIGLLDYIMEKNGSNKLMTFAEGELTACLSAFGGGVDIMQGRPMPIEGVQRLLNRFGPRILHNVHWLVETVDRAKQYAALNLPMKICVQLECGVMRGGPTTNEELLAILNVLASSRTIFSGFMGYDGHVIYAPLTAQIPGAPVVLTEDQEFANVNQKYTNFVAAAKAAFPQWFTQKLIFNGGGSTSLNYYNKGLVTPMNDVSFGIGYLCPSNYAQWLEAFGLVNACYCCSFITTGISPAQMQFEPGWLPQLAQTNPLLQACYYINSGGFAAGRVFPPNPDASWDGTTPALIDNPYVPNDPSGEMFSNMQQFYGPTGVINLEDNVFFRPYESSSIAWLGTLVAIRGNQVVNEWKTMQSQPG